MNSLELWPYEQDLYKIKLARLVNSSVSNTNCSQWVTKGGHEGGRSVLCVSSGSESGELEADMTNIHSMCI